MITQQTLQSILNDKQLHALYEWKVKLAQLSCPTITIKNGEFELDMIDEKTRVKLDEIDELIMFRIDQIKNFYK